MSDPQPDPAGAHEELRPLLTSIAYRMLGSVSDAEDIVQEAFLRFHRAARDEEIANPRAYLSTVTTRLAIDHLRLARVQRERYIGPWLPEPVVEDEAADPGAAAEIADSVSMALLVALERLSPVERAVFLLHDVFDLPFEEVASVVERTEANCRQLASRARRHIDDERPRFEVSAARRDELTERFLNAAATGDREGLEQMLAADVVAYTDGGGHVTAARKPVYGAEKVATFAINIARPGRAGDVASLVAAWVNDGPGRLLLDAEGRVVGVLSLDILDDKVQAVHLVVNPEKLTHIPPHPPGPPWQDPA
jgi:RNA polymerase sigma-70 factor (ECF subfamily)